MHGGGAPAGCMAISCRSRKDCTAGAAGVLLLAVAAVLAAFAALLAALSSFEVPFVLPAARRSFFFFFFFWIPFTIADTSGESMRGSCHDRGHLRNGRRAGSSQSFTWFRLSRPFLNNNNTPTHKLGQRCEENASYLHPSRPSYLRRRVASVLPAQPPGKS